MAGEEVHDLSLVLLEQHGAGSVDHTPVFANQRRGGIEDGGLARDQLGEVSLGQALPCVGVAAPHAGAGAGRIDEHAVETLCSALGPFVARLKQMTFDVRHTGAAQAADCVLQPRGGRVARHELAAVVHGHRKRQRLAAGASAEVPQTRCPGRASTRAATS